MQKGMAEKIRTLRKERRLTLEQVAKVVGVGKSTVRKWETGMIANMRRDKIASLAAALGTTPAYLMGWEEDTKSIPDGFDPVPAFVNKPRLGVIACGEPILAEQNIEDYDSVPEHINCDFTLKCKGDSMIDARIMDGDIVYIKEQPTVENGEIAAVLIGDEATLKRVYLNGSSLTLLPCNSKYPPLVYNGSELENIRIIGKAVGFTSLVV